MIKIIHSIDEKYHDDLFELFQATYWTTDRTFDEFNKMILHTDFLAVAIDEKKDKLIGITRVLTDFTYIALICDVMVLPDYHKKGVGKNLLDSIVQANEFKNIKQLELYCRDELVPFYEKWGFEIRDELNFMRKK